MNVIVKCTLLMEIERGNLLLGMLSFSLAVANPLPPPPWAKISYNRRVNRPKPLELAAGVHGPASSIVITRVGGKTYREPRLVHNFKQAFCGDR